MNDDRAFDAIVLIHRFQPGQRLEGCRRPLLLCAEMFLDLKDIERRRWRMWRLRQTLRSAGLDACTLADFLQAEDVDWLERNGARVAHEWYLDGGVDQTLYRGISLGRCIEYDVKAGAIRLLKLSLSVQRVLQRHPDAKRLTDFGPDSTEWRLLEPLGFSALNIQAVPISRRASDQPVSPRGSIKRRFVSNARRAGLALVKALSSMPGRGGRSGPLVIVRLGMQSSRMLERWLAGPRYGLRFSLWMDYLMRPRTVLALVRAGARILGPSSPSTVEDGPGFDTVRARLLGGLPVPEAPFRAALGTLPQGLLDDMLRRVAGNGFQAARSAIDDAYRAMTSTEIALLILPNDCQPLLRAWTLVARRLSKPTLVVQHGHLDYTEDEDHLTASHSAFWSEMVAEHFLGAGLQRQQIFVSGSPNTERQPATLSTRRADRRSAGSRPQVLIITTGNPGVQAYVPETWVCDYIAGVLDALQPKLAELDITVKLHPGEDSALYREGLGARLPQAALISDRGDLARLIAAADVVISPPSTVVLEARAAGTPVILLPVASPNGRTTTLRHVEGVVTVSRYEDLTDAIGKLLAGGVKREPGSWPLSRFVGPLDASASERLLDAVRLLAHGAEGHVEARIGTKDERPDVVH